MAASRILTIGIASLLLFSGCSKLSAKFGRLTGNKTKVSFGLAKGKGLNPMSALPGGVMVYAIDATGGAQDYGIAFSSEDVANASASLTLDNRAYRFYAFGYTGSGLTGTVKCGFGNGGQTIGLNGTDTTVVFTLNVDNCADPGFSGDANLADATNGVDPLAFVSCDSGKDLSTVIPSDTCAADRGDMHNVRSMKVYVNTYDPGGTDHRAGISSACIRGDGTQGFTAVDGDSTIGNSAHAVHITSAGDYLFGGVNAGIAISDDFGTTYTETTTSSAEVYGFFENEDGTLYAATANSALNGGLYTSTDLGATWSKIMNTDSINLPSSGLTGDFYTVASSGDAILAGGYQELHVSDDAGASWTSLDFTADFNKITSSLIDEYDGNYYIGGYYDSGSTVTKVWRSTDLGVSWTSFEEFTESVGSGEFVTYRRDPDGTHLLGSVGGLRISTDSGSTWNLFNNTLGDWGTATDNVLTANKFDGTIFAGLNNGIVFTTDEGSTWTATLANTNPVDSMYYDDHTLFLTQRMVDPGMFMSDNRGSGLTISPGTAIRVPGGGGGPDGFVDTSVQYFYDANCTIEARSYEFPFGLENSSYPDDPSEIRSNATTTKIFLNDF